MKKTSAALLIFVSAFSVASSAIEIQCNTQNAGTDYIIKTSENSGITYSLILKNDTLDSYYKLENSKILFKPEIFKYQDENLKTAIDLNQATGTATYTDVPPLNLSNCKDFKN